jgi:glyoxylase-like metal-dependent hydrolase (beta-lactamase superfamily II)
MSDGRLSIGNVQIVGLADVAVDAPLTLDQAFPGVPADAWEPYRERYPGVFRGPNVWHLDIGCYLLRSRGRTILVDTGIGPASTPISALLQTEGRLLEALRAEGVGPDDVDTVIISHLHVDHVGWNVQEENGRARLTFPRARYLVHEADWAAFQRPEVQERLPFQYVDQLVTPLLTLGGLELTSDGRAVTDELTLLHTPGHTPGHQSVLVVSGSERAILSGDALVHPAQVTEPEWLFFQDLDSAQAVQTRRQLLDRIEAEGMTVAACHFLEGGFGRLVRLEGRRYWQGL